MVYFSVVVFLKRDTSANFPREHCSNLPHHISMIEMNIADTELKKLPRLIPTNSEILRAKTICLFLL